MQSGYLQTFHRGILSFRSCFTIIPTPFLNNCSYVDRKKVVGGDEAAYEYRWGSRAEKELTKRQVLQFVSEVCEKFICSTYIRYTCKVAFGAYVAHTAAFPKANTP